MLIVHRSAVLGSFTLQFGENSTLLKAELVAFALIIDVFRNAAATAWDDDRPYEGSHGA